MRTAAATLLALLALLPGPGTVPRAQAADQTSLAFVQVTTDDGLPQMFVQAIHQDREGFLWFGTKDGLARYDGYDFTVYRPAPFDSTSLSGNHVTAVLEDGDGRLWVGTAENGLDLLDRRTGRFTRFSRLPGSVARLADDRITALCEDDEGGIWVGSRGGLDRIVVAGRGRTGAADSSAQAGGPGAASFLVTHHGSEVGDPASLAGSQVQTLLRDAAGTIWIGTKTGLQSALVEGGAVRFRSHPLDAALGARDHSIEAIAEDDRGRLWLGAPGGLLDLDRGSGRVTLHRPPGDLAGRIGSVDAIHQAPELPGLAPGSLWLGTYGGAVLYDPTQDGFRLLQPDLRDGRGPPASRVLVVTVDRGGVVWLGTNGRGVYKLSPRAVRFPYPDCRWERTPGDVVSCRDLSVRAIHTAGPADPGVLWLGAEGLYRVDRRRGLMRPVNREAFGRDDVGIVYAIDADATGRLWVGTGQGLFSWDPATGERGRHDEGLPSRPDGADRRVFRVLCAPDGAVWLATARTLGRLDPGTGRIRHFVYDDAPAQRFEPPRFPPLHRDPDGTIWLGTPRGLLRLDPGATTFAAYRHDPRDRRSLAEDVVLAIAADPDRPERYLWVGTAGGGLDRLDRREGTFGHVGRAEGLASSYVYGILTDDEGALWVSTNEGLSRYDPTSRTVRNYGAADGLQGHEFNAGAYYRSEDGELLFGGINGLNVFRPECVLPDSFLAPVAITRVEIDGRPVPAEPEVVLDHTRKVISFEFAALSYAASERNRYAYLLQGSGRSWIELGTERRVTFMNLAPGDYLFQVRGSNGDGIWNPVPAGILLRVEPPPWNTWWAWTGYLLLALGLLAGVRRYELGRVRMKHSLALLQEDVRVAARIQRGLMPTRAPRLAGYDIAGRNIPNRGVGGDYYDFVAIDDDRLAICLGDVAGKGLPAALVMANFQAVVRSEAILEAAPRRCAERVNRVLHRSTAPGTFVTFFYALLDRRDNVLRYCNAGHERPLLVAPDGDCSLLDGAGLVLGIMEDAEYREQRCGFGVGDVLLIYSDGITDALDEAERPFGDRRLAATLRRHRDGSAAEIVAAVLGSVRRHIGHQQPPDDMTLVVIKRTG